jgi:hypothetical protein
MASANAKFLAAFVEEQLAATPISTPGRPPWLAGLPAFCEARKGV